MKKPLTGAKRTTRMPLCGQHHWRAKLTDQDVELMRQLFDDGMKVTALADKFDISKSHASRITRYLKR